MNSIYPLHHMLGKSCLMQKNLPSRHPNSKNSYFSTIFATYRHSTPRFMDECKQKQPKIQNEDTEVSSIEWEFIDMTEQEEDMISRMYRLVGDRWGLIAGRVPGRKPEEIERFWLMRNSDSFKNKRIQQKIKRISS